MAGEPISQMPLAISVNGASDYMPIAQYTGIPGALYVSKKIPVQTAANLFATNLPAAVVYEMDGGGLVLTTGVKGYLTMPFNGTIVSAELLSTSASTTTIDIWKTTYALFDAGATHPVVGDSITASRYLTLVSSVKYLDSTLTGWTTSFSKGDIFAFSILANSSSQHVTVSLGVSRTVP